MTGIFVLGCGVLEYILIFFSISREAIEPLNAEFELYETLPNRFLQ
jgi:hypothetical protein